MLNTLIIIAALLLEDRSVFAQQSKATLFFPLPSYSSLYIGSIVESDATATTYTLACSPGIICPLPTPCIWTDGPSTVAYTKILTASLNLYSGIEHTVTFPAGPQTEIWTCSVNPGAVATTGVCVDDWHGPWANHITTMTTTSANSLAPFVINLTNDLAAVVASPNWTPTTTVTGFTLPMTGFGGFQNPTGITVTYPPQTDPNYTPWAWLSSLNTRINSLARSTGSVMPVETMGTLIPVGGTGPVMPAESTGSQISAGITGSSETGVRTAGITEVSTTVPALATVTNGVAIVTKAPWIGAAALGVAALAFH